MTRVQSSQQATVSCDSLLTGLKGNLCIHPSTLELSVNARMCKPCPNCWIVMYIDIADNGNSNRFSVIFLCHSDGIIHSHAKPLSLQPPMKYLHAPYHSFNVGLTNTMLLIGTPLVAICRSNSIHS